MATLDAAGAASATPFAALTAAIRCVGVATASAVAAAALTVPIYVASATPAASATATAPALSTEILLVAGGTASASGYNSLSYLNSNNAVSAIGAASLATAIRLASSAPSLAAVGYAAIQIPLKTQNEGTIELWLGMADLTTGIPLTIAATGSAVGQASLYGGFYNAFGTVSVTVQASLYGGFTVAQGTASAVGTAALTTVNQMVAAGLARANGVAFFASVLSSLGSALPEARADGLAWLYLEPASGIQVANVLTARLVAAPKHQRIIATRAT